MQVNVIQEDTLCPLTGKRCTRADCQWWLGEACAVCYIGASCKEGMRPWRRRE